jgi:hypothetical protein
MMMRGLREDFRVNLSARLRARDAAGRPIGTAFGPGA